MLDRDSDRFLVRLEPLHVHGRRKTTAALRSPGRDGIRQADEYPASTGFAGCTMIIEPLLQSRRMQPPHPGYVNGEVRDTIRRDVGQTEFIERPLVVARFFNRLVDARSFPPESRRERQLDEGTGARRLQNRIQQIKERIFAVGK